MASSSFAISFPGTTSSRPWTSGRWTRGRRWASLHRSPRSRLAFVWWPVNLRKSRCRLLRLESNNPHAERGEHELGPENRGLILRVENRIDLDDVERQEAAGVGGHLHDHVRFTVIEAAFDRRADAGRDRRIADVHVERHVNAERVLAGQRERALHD